MKHLCRSFLLFIGFVMPLARAGWADVTVTLENPAPNQKVSGIGTISGWAFSSIPGAHVSVSVSIDGQAPISIPCCADRADVARDHGPQALNSGFGQVFNFNILSGNTHSIKVTASDDHGGSASSANISFTEVKPGGFEVLSLLDLLLADPKIDGQEIVLDKVQAVEKVTSKKQEVTIRLAWQQSTQTLGIVASQNTTATSTAQAAQTEQATDGQSQASAEPAITVTLENPPDQKTASGVGVVSGWAVSSTPGATISSVQFQIDGQQPNKIPCCSDRKDVADALPDQPQALHSGFGALYNFNILPGGPHTIDIGVQDSTGASAGVHGSLITVKPGNFEFLDQFDLSAAQVSLQGQILVLDNVQVRDKATQQVEPISAHYAWQASCQCFVIQSLCGNDSVEPTEECDGTDLAGESCTSLGFSGGTLGCSNTCEFETKDCTGGPRLYVTNLVDNTVSVINTATNTVEGQPIPVGQDPRGIVISPDGATAYVTNSADDTVSVINTATNSVTATITLRQAKELKRPQGIAIAPDGTKVYVVNGFDSSVAVIDTSTKKVLTNIEVGKAPQEIALTADGTRAYVTSFATDSVSVLDLTSNTAVTTVAVGDTPDGVAVSPDDTRVYVANYNFDEVANGDSVSVIDNIVSPPAPVGNPLAVRLHPVKVAFSPDGTRAYVSSSAASTVEVIDTAGPATVNEILTQDEPNGIAVGAKGKRLYVALFGHNGGAQDVAVLSPISGGTIALIPVGHGPLAVALTPPGP
ncbi:MAG TPA: YncE family protein [Candidatus Binatia bacterium]|nr:YncE family protein [Candidatus Binatia bacterium]